RRDRPGPRRRRAHDRTPLAVCARVPRQTARWVAAARGRMTDERRKTVARLFDLALDLAPAERTALLARECRGDAALRAEVEALLAADTGAAAAALEDLTPQRSVELQPGELVADRYRVVRLLGEGGMG